MRLSKDQIQFIDTYLKNSDILFADVRMEMVDHVAIAIEKDMQENNRSFYDAFKSYMVCHKKELQKTNASFKWVADKKVFLKICKNLLHTFCITALVLSFGFLKVLSISSSIEKSLTFVPFGLLALIGMVYLVFFYRGGRIRFSGLERMGLFIFVFYELVNLFGRQYLYEQVLGETGETRLVVTTLFIWLASSIIKSIVDLNREYQQNYSKLHT